MVVRPDGHVACSIPLLLDEIDEEGGGKAVHALVGFFREAGYGVGGGEGEGEGGVGRRGGVGRKREERRARM